MSQESPPKIAFADWDEHGHKKGWKHLFAKKKSSKDLKGATIEVSKPSKHSKRTLDTIAESPTRVSLNDISDLPVNSSHTSNSISDFAHKKRTSTRSLSKKGQVEITRHKTLAAIQVHEELQVRDSDVHLLDEFLSVSLPSNDFRVIRKVISKEKQKKDEDDGHANKESEEDPSPLSESLGMDDEKKDLPSKSSSLESASSALSGESTPPKRQSRANSLEEERSRKMNPPEIKPFEIDKNEKKSEKEKRMWSESVRSSFVFSDKKKKIYEEERLVFKTKMEDLLRKKTLCKVEWVELFHTTMKAKKNVFSDIQMSHFEALFTNYLQIANPVNSKKESKSHSTLNLFYTQEAESGLSFVQSHKWDPCNCLIGLVPTDFIAKEAQQHFNMHHNHQPKQNALQHRLQEGGVMPNARRRHTLLITVDRAHGLQAVDMSGSSDPFVKLTLLGKGIKFKTKVKKRTLAPVFEETFTFENVDLSDKLKIKVYDWDRIGRNSGLGSVEVSIEQLLSLFKRKGKGDEWLLLEGKHVTGTLHVLYTFEEADVVTSTVGDSMGNHDPTTFRYDAEIIKKQQLLSKILQWGEIKDNAMLANEVRRFCGYLKQMTLKPGDLILCKLSESKENVFSINMGKYGSVIYARYAGNQDNLSHFIEIYTDPLEQTKTKINRKFVVPLGSLHMLEWIANMDKVETLEMLVHKPHTVLFEEIKAKVDEKAKEHLASEGVNVSLLDKSRGQPTDIAELEHYHELMEKLQKLSENPDEKQISHLFEQEDALYEEKLSSLPSNNFYPTIDQTTQLIKSFSCAQVYKRILLDYITRCESIIKILESKKEEILNGMKKSILTQWWLNLCKDKCNEFLMGIEMDGLSYKFEAVPGDYLDTPPASLKDIQSNLAMIRQLLDKNEDHFHVQEKLIDPLKVKIYKEIDSFIRQVMILLFQMFPKVPTTMEDFNIDAVAEYVSAHGAKMLDANKLEQVENLLKDYKYLKLMKATEFSFYNRSSQKHESMPDVIPITGVIMSRFFRLENELTTVNDHWKGKMFYKVV